MPALSTAQQQLLDQWQKTKNAPTACVGCGAQDPEWHSGWIVAMPVVDAYGKIQQGVFSDPVLELCCSECGYMLYYSATRLGLV